MSPLLPIVGASNDGTSIILFVDVIRWLCLLGDDDDDEDEGV